METHPATRQRLLVPSSRALCELAFSGMVSVRLALSPYRIALAVVRQGTGLSSPLQVDGHDGSGFQSRS